MSHKSRNHSSSEVPALLVIGLVAAGLAFVGPFMHFILAGLAIIVLFKAIEAMAGTRNQASQFQRYKDLIGAILCFIFGGVSGFFDLIGTFMLIGFALNLIKGNRKIIPPTPDKQKSTASRTNSSYSHADKPGGYYANTSSGTSQNVNPYSKINEEDIVQQARNFMNNQRVNLSKATRTPAASYQHCLDTLRKNIKDLDAREETVSAFLDDFFEGSTVSKSRYLQTIKNAHARMETIYEKAQQAVQMFGQTEPTAERMEILDRYVQDSNEIMQKVEKVIDELIMVQQNDVISDGSVLDDLLDDLASTTSYYQRSPYKNSVNNTAPGSSQNGGMQMPG